MTRRFYRALLQLHPASFRRRFAAEMLDIFDEPELRGCQVSLVLDGLASLARQWLLRRSLWIVALSLAGAVGEIPGLLCRMAIHRPAGWNRQPLTPHLEQLLFLTVGLVCGLLLAVLTLTVWIGSFERRRTAGGLASPRRRARLSHRHARAA